MKNKVEKEEQFIWYGTRISFYLMLFFDFLIAVTESEEALGWMSIIFLGLTIFCFVTSIIHLTKYKEKKLAIVSLVISSLFLLIMLIVSVMLY